MATVGLEGIEHLFPKDEALLPLRWRQEGPYDKSPSYAPKTLSLISTKFDIVVFSNLDFVQMSGLRPYNKAYR